MKVSRAEYYAKSMENLQQRDRIFLRNPVFITGLGLAPIVVAATTVQNALILGLAVLLLLTPTRVLAAIISKRVVYRFRGVVYVLTSSTVFIGVYIVLRMVFGIQLQTVGLYLPVLVMEPLIVKRYEKPSKEKVRTAFLKGVLTTVGFELALFLVAALREFLAFGTLYGIKIMPWSPAPIMSLACGGFILVGVIAAVWRAMSAKFKKNVYQEVKDNNGR